jgi:peptidoglycan/xylan/chitin deacetylase (PgdA/CDA1 family)
MIDVDAQQQIVAGLRESVQALQSEETRLEADLDRLDEDISRLCGVARDLGHGGTLPEARSPRVNRGAILLYHRVASLSPDPAGLCIPTDLFRAQMEHVARTCEPMTLSALTEAADQAQIPRRAVAITLDDGYADALTAAEILSTLQLPATFFVNSNAGGETLLDSLTRIFLEGQPIQTELAVSVMGTTVRLPCGSDQARRAAFDALREIAWPLSSGGRRELLAAVRRWSGLDLPPRSSHRLLTPAELRELASRPGQEIGAHTENHLFLPVQPRSTKISEIATNREYLQALLGRDVRSFAYPYGAFDLETVQICRSMGFHSCVTVIGQPVRPWSDPWLLPRNEVKAQTVANFEAFVGALYV